jgi:hypothetical protein
MPKRKYTWEMLKKFVDENNIILIGDYKNTHLTAHSKINGNCLNVKKCSQNFSKTFLGLIKYGAYCKDCQYIISKKRREDTNIKIHGVSNISQSSDIKEKKKTTTLQNWGVEIPAKSSLVIDKIKATNMSKYGHENTFQVTEFKEKSKVTNINNYGYEYASQSESTKEKMEQTNMKRYGVLYPIQNKEIFEKMQNTIFDKYGYNNISQVPEIKEQKKETTMKNYGYEYAMQSPDIQNKIKYNNLEKYGVEHHMQNANIAEQHFKKSFAKKEYLFPSGNIIYLQGYEPFAIDILISENIEEEDIVTEKNKVPEIWYNDDEGKLHRHYVDIYIKSKNLCIEIKSEWTITIENDKILNKKYAGIELGYEYEIWVISNKGKLLNKY